MAINDDAAKFYRNKVFGHFFFVVGTFKINWEEPQS